MALGVDVLGTTIVFVNMKVDFVVPVPAQHVDAQHDHQRTDDHFQTVGHLFKDHGVAPQHYTAHQKQHDAVDKAPGHALLHYLLAVGRGAGK